MFTSPFPPGAERRGATSSLTGSPTLTNVSSGNRNNSDFFPVANKQEKKILSPSYSRVRKEENDTIFSQKSFVLAYVEMYQFNTYRKLIAD